MNQLNIKDVDEGHEIENTFWENNTGVWFIYLMATIYVKTNLNFSAYVALYSMKF